MHDQGFLKRLQKIGFGTFIKSTDFILGLVALFVISSLKNGYIPQESADALLQTISGISASLFAIILAGLTIITSFTDRQFIYAWKKVGKFDEVMTLFQYYLYLPLIVLIFSLTLAHVRYHGSAMIILSALFVYTILGMFSLVGFIVKYGLQRVEFVTDQIENGKDQTLTMDDLEAIAAEHGYKLVDEDKTELSTEKLEKINEALNDETESE